MSISYIMSNVFSIYNSCSECQCGRQTLFDSDPLGEKYKALKLVRKDLNRILGIIPLIENPA
ncbi:hypothetical protein AUK10_03660 [Candidatus Gracilibacteria bacterium CG2_30_37_12]|nr:MAG: hypothetical protein AUK10_03660 [Candidatus Gracilibacteria bacterium CG2_30_37_12]